MTDIEEKWSQKVTAVYKSGLVSRQTSSVGKGYQETFQYFLGATQY